MFGLIATSGQTYHIAVDGYGGSSGSITLALRAGVAPANDDLADALTLAGPLPISSAASNVDATKEVGEPCTTRGPSEVRRCGSAGRPTRLAR